MAHSSAWLTQDIFEREADRCLAEDDVTLDTITPYYVAQKLRRNANATVYRLFREWKARRVAEAGGPPLHLPAEMIEPLSMMADRFKADLMASNVALLGTAMRTIEADANLKVATARRALADAEEYAERILEAWESETTALGEAQARIASLERERDGCRTEVARLEGRFQQIMDDRARATATGPKRAATMMSAAEVHGGKRSGALRPAFPPAWRRRSPQAPSVLLAGRREVAPAPRWRAMADAVRRSAMPGHQAGALPSGDAVKAPPVSERGKGGSGVQGVAPMARVFSSQRGACHTPPRKNPSRVPPFR